MASAELSGQKITSSCAEMRSSIASRVRMGGAFPAAFDAEMGVDVKLLPDAQTGYSALDRVVMRMQAGWQYHKI